MAKQFGVSDTALDGLKDPARHPFPADQKAALRFADAMTDGPGAVPEETFRELRRHFSEPQIVEIATVIGVFNYFNRFNNALHTEITLTDPDVLVQRVREAVQAAAGAEDLCERVADILRQGRRYARVAIDRRRKDIDTTAHTGATRPVDGLLRAPIRAGGATVGIIEVESSSAAFDDEDRSLVERVAGILAGPLAGLPA